MSVELQPNGRWRAQIHNPATGRNVSVSTVLGRPGTYWTKAEARLACIEARELLKREREGSRS